MNYSKDWLQEKLRQNESVDYLFFWGHTVYEPVRETCFSQWYPSPFVVDGFTYATAEHWMMAGKARTFGDDEILNRLAETDSPAEAKKLGRAVKNFDPKIWDQVKFQLVCDGNYHKFAQHTNMKSFLLNTGTQVIVEASPRDTIWGIGLGRENPKARNPFTWRGKNLLGFALMEVRDELR